MKKKKFLTLLFIGLFCSFNDVSADSFIAQTIGGSSNDVSRAVVQTPDGGYVVGGSVFNIGAGGLFDAYAAKFTPEGALDTGFGTGGTVTVGGSSGENIYDMIVADDDGIVLIGSTASFGAGGGDVYIVKLTSAGVLDTSFGTNGTVAIGGAGTEYGRSIIQSSDGGYVIIGGTASFGAGGDDVYIVKLTSAGALDAGFGTGGTVTVGGTNNDMGYSVVEDSDGGYVFAGWTASFGVDGSDMYVFKLTSAGALDTAFGQSGTVAIGGANYEYGRKIVKASDDGFVVFGYSDDFVFGHDDVYMAKLTSSGALDTDFGVGGTRVIGGSGADELSKAIQVSDGGYLLVGSTSSEGAGDADAYIIKITSDGDFDTSFNSDGTMTLGGSNGDYAYGVIENSDGNYVVTGSIRAYGEGGQDLYIIQMSAAGDAEECSYVSGSGGSLSNGGSLSAAGATLGSGGSVSSGGVVGSGGTLNTQCSSPKPVLTEITPISSPTTDPTPSYVFNSTAAGDLTYGGSCDSGDVSALVGDNTVAFSTLANGTYDDCTVIVENIWGEFSDALQVTEFIVDITGGNDNGESGDDEQNVDEVDIPKPDLGLKGKLKDLVLSKKKKIHVKKDEIKFKGKFEDIAGGKVVIKYKKGSKSKEKEVEIDGNGKWSKEIDFDKDGSYKIKFTFYNKNGKEIGKKGYYKVKIDTEDPEIANMPSQLTKRVGDKVWWDAKDDEGIDKYKYIFNGKKTKTKDAFFHVPEGTPPGTYDLEIRAYDDAGNKDVKNIIIVVR